MRFLRPLFTFIALVSFSAQAQNVIQVEIDHGALHCPYLSPRFKDRFTELNSIDSVRINTETSIGYLYLGEGRDITDEEITDIIVNKVGYPLPEIKAIIRNED